VRIDGLGECLFAPRLTSILCKLSNDVTPQIHPQGGAIFLKWTWPLGDILKVAPVEGIEEF
jgi:hypothetical protein